MSMGLMDVKGVSITKPLTFKPSFSSLEVTIDSDLRLGLICICAATTLAATPAPRLCPHNTSFESWVIHCETQSSAAIASRAIPRSDGRPREVQKPRYERATIPYFGAMLVNEDACRLVRTTERPGKGGGKEEALLFAALALAVYIPVGIHIPVKINN